MSNEYEPRTDPGQPVCYQIRIKGHLGRQWTDWFGGLSITLEEDEETVLTGPVVDQAALHGLLKKVRDVGLPLLAVNRVQPGPANMSEFNQLSFKISEEKTVMVRERLNQEGTKKATMKTILFKTYGSPDVLEFADVEKPAPRDNEVLVKVYAASANPLDWHIMRAEPFLARLEAGLQKPKNTKLGADIAGRVEAVGRNVTQFKPGDEVFGDLFRDISTSGLGGFAEYVCANEDAVALKPASMTFERAAAVPVAAFTALQGLRDKGQIKPGQRILINGASGGVGTFAVQIAKSYGAEVTGVCSTRNLDLVRSIGADHVIDYTKEDFTRNGKHYDLIFDAVGNRSVSDYQRALTPNGICAVAGFTSLSRLFQIMLLGAWVSKTGSRKVGLMATVKPNKKDLMIIKELLETGKVVPVIDRTYPFREIPEAIRYLEKGHAKGKVVITVEQRNNKGRPAQG